MKKRITYSLLLGCLLLLLNPVCAASYYVDSDDEICQQTDEEEDAVRHNRRPHQHRLQLSDYHQPPPAIGLTLTLSTTEAAEEPLVALVPHNRQALEAPSSDADSEEDPFGGSFSEEDDSDLHTEAINIQEQNPPLQAASQPMLSHSAATQSHRVLHVQHNQLGLQINDQEVQQNMQQVVQQGMQLRRRVNRQAGPKNDNEQNNTEITHDLEQDQQHHTQEDSHWAENLLSAGLGGGASTLLIESVAKRTVEKVVTKTVEKTVTKMVEKVVQAAQTEKVFVRSQSAIMDHPLYIVERVKEPIIEMVPVSETITETIEETVTESIKDAQTYLAKKALGEFATGVGIDLLAQSGLQLWKSCTKKKKNGDKMTWKESFQDCGKEIYKNKGKMVGQAVGSAACGVAATAFLVSNPSSWRVAGTFAVGVAARVVGGWLGRKLGSKLDG